MKSHFRIGTLMVLLTLTAGCQTSCPPSSRPPNTLFETYYPIELGNGSNTFSSRGALFYVGHRVERFRLRVRFFNPRPFAPSIPGDPNPVPLEDQSIPGVNLTFHTDTVDQIVPPLPPNTPRPGANPDGSFLTNEILGNWVEIRIDSGGSRIDFQGGQPRFEILAVERHFRPGSNANDVPTTTLPTASANPGFVQIGRLQNNTEVIGFLPGLGEAQHYRIAPGNVPRTESLYISPRYLFSGLNNSTGVKVHISNTGFAAPADTSIQWIEAAPGDSGIYTEFQNNPQQPTFVTVISALATPFLIRNTALVEGFGNIVMERDRRMGAAPAIDLTAIRNGTNLNNPFNSQIADYVHANADFDRRIRETMVIASAFALDGSDGQMRFQSADLYRDIDFFRNVDIQFSVCSDGNDPACRANAGSFHIDMFTLDLSHPVDGGWTLHHEWGHWQYDLPDEYTDVNGPPPQLFSLAIDANSLMGTRGFTEFCMPSNHLWAPNAGGEEESCWTQIADQYTEVANDPILLSRLSHGRYLDVLHKLDSLLILTTH